MKRRVPFVEEDEPVMEVILGINRFVVIFLIAVPLLGSPVIGLGAVLLARGDEGDSLQTWITIATVASLVAAALGVAGVVGFFLDGHGTVWELGTAGLIAGCSLATFLLLRGMTQIDGTDALSGYALAGTATGAISFVLCALTKPTLESPFNTRNPYLPKRKYMHARYERARATVLETLERRGLVHLSPTQRAALMQTPMGSWHTFDPE